MKILDELAPHIKVFIAIDHVIIICQSKAAMPIELLIF